MAIEQRGAQTLVLRLVPEPKDLNYNGHVSGGWILGNMDRAGGIAAYRRAGGPIVTVAVENMVFVKPLLLNDFVSFHTEVVRVGRTSVTTDVELWIERPHEDGERLMAHGRYIYVAIDDEAHPRPLDMIGA
jgi:acyl-CoA thioesterase YciA